MTAWKSGVNAPLGYPVPGNVDASALVPVGTIAKFFDETQGEGEFIYLPGVAATVAGDCVDYDLAPGAQVTVRHTNATGSNSGRPVAWATAAVVANKYGWYQIGGVVIANVAAGFAAGSKIFSTATAGVVDDGADAGDQIIGAYGSTAITVPAAGQAYVTINRPSMQTQIT
jgi:hypothetical protein